MTSYRFGAWVGSNQIVFPSASVKSHRQVATTNYATAASRILIYAGCKFNVDTQFINKSTLGLTRLSVHLLTIEWPTTRLGLINQNANGKNSKQHPTKSALIGLIGARYSIWLAVRCYRTSLSVNVLSLHSVKGSRDKGRQFGTWEVAPQGECIWTGSKWGNKMRGKNLYQCQGIFIISLFAAHKYQDIILPWASWLVLCTLLSISLSTLLSIYLIDYLFIYICLLDWLAGDTH